MKVGDYVRTKEGYICKILEIHEEYDDEYLDWNDIGSASIRKSHIVKSSSNIIDLIEVGDYVNGLLVDKNKYGELFTAYVYYGGDIGKQYEVYTIWLKDYRKDMIEKIVTKEQFEAIQYKIGGNDD